MARKKSRKKKSKKSRKPKRKPKAKKKKRTAKKGKIKKAKKKKRTKKKKTTKKKKKTSSKKKKSKAKPAQSPTAIEEDHVDGVLLGRVEDYFAHIGVLALTLEAPLSVGDTIRIKSMNTDFTQTVDSIQIEHSSVSSANPGDSVGIKVSERAHKNNRVYKV